MPSKVAKPTQQKIALLAEQLSRSYETVLADMPVVARMRADPIWTINKFFVKRGAWLYDPLEDWQEGIINRWFSQAPDVLEVLARFHTKTLLGGRIAPALFALYGRVGFHMCFSYSEENYEGNLNAVWMILTSPLFEDLQWYMPYFHGTELPHKSGNTIRMGGGNMVKFRSLMGETRGANDPEAGGRPDMITLDDIMPTAGMSSQAIREEIKDRYLSMVVPMLAKNGQTRITATITHEDDLINNIVEGKIGGFIVTPEAHRAAYNEQTHEVLFKSRYTYETLMKLYEEKYVKMGRAHLWAAEMLNKIVKTDRRPFYGKKLTRFAKKSVLPFSMYRVVVVDSATGSGKDWTVIVELGMDYKGRVYQLSMKRSNEWREERKVHETIATLKARRPHALICEENTDSKPFIQGLNKELDREALHITFHTPTAASRGNKNLHIKARLEPIVDKNDFCIPEEDTYTESEFVNFDITKKDQIDDLLDADALGVTYLIKPEVDSITGGIPGADELTNEVLHEIFGDKKDVYRGGCW